MDWSAEGKEMFYAGLFLGHRLAFPQWDAETTPDSVVITRVNDCDQVVDMMARKFTELDTWAHFQAFMDDVSRAVQADILTNLDRLNLPHNYTMGVDPGAPEGDRTACHFSTGKECEG